MLFLVGITIPSVASRHQIRFSQANIMTTKFQEESQNIANAVKQSHVSRGLTARTLRFAKCS